MVRQKDAHMKQFFTIVFGGLLVVALGVALAYGGAVAWRAIRPELAQLRLPTLASVAGAIISRPDDGTAVSGLRRTVEYRYTASEEEDLITAASMALPYSGGNRAKGGDKVTALAYLVKNLTAGNGNGSPVSLNPDRLMPIASLTKLVTAAVALQLIPLNQRVIISEKVISTYGNTAGFKVGETFEASDLMYPLLMVSSNDAAEALAETYGRAKFIRTMNEFTQSIGAYRSYFVDASGLSAENVSTASDLVIILDWLRKNDPSILAVTELKSKTVRNHTWVNPTHFLSLSNYAGGKNGYTPEANRTAASLFTLGKNKDLVAVVVLGSGSRDTDELHLLSRIAE